MVQNIYSEDGRYCGTATICGNADGIAKQKGNNYMTKNNAITELNNGNKVYHKSYSPHEYIYVDGICIMDENDRMLGTISDYFDSLTESKWDNGWNIYNAL